VVDCILEKDLSQGKGCQWTKVKEKGVNGQGSSPKNVALLRRTRKESFTLAVIKGLAMGWE